MRSTVVATCVAVALLGAPRAAQAQHLSLGPTIGFYVPTEDLVAAASNGGTSGKVEAGISFGGRLGLWLGNRIGLEVSGNYVPTTYTLTTSTNQITQQDVKLFNGAGQLVVFLLPPTGLLSLHVNAGVGVVSHGGVAFTSQAKTTQVSAVGGAGVGLNLVGIMINAGADLFGYSSSFTGTTQTSSKLTQYDLQLHLGLGVPFGGSGH